LIAAQASEQTGLATFTADSDSKCQTPALRKLHIAYANRKGLKATVRPRTVGKRTKNVAEIIRIGFYGNKSLISGTDKILPRADAVKSQSKHDQFV
jgi:hypothetical protein